MADIVQLVENGVKKFVKSHVKAVEGLESELTAIKTLTTDQIEMKASPIGTGLITIVPKWDCQAEVQCQFNGWGYGGQRWKIQINTPTGLTKLVNGIGIVEGNDNVNRNVCFTSVFTGLKKGVSYTFTRENLEGKVGGTTGECLIVRLYRTGS